ncbi:hypothetical protein ACFLXY_08175 [Chloroflexota bacterium]
MTILRTAGEVIERMIELIFGNYIREPFHQVLKTYPNFPYNTATI